ncbi:TIGR03620 family F420-dependent LLM class oxidoreductase [Kribbella lupini]|uniref:TIGR03620 family F420-dependent LLM class oxidoreductase n=1 Tax=Kribbella lupini TaxID=291602 RepID=A0ABP4M3A4_9ACTN
MNKPSFGSFGITTGLTSSPESLDAARIAEDLGYPAIWLSGGPLPGLQTIRDLVEATNTIRYVSGILSVDTYPAEDVAATYAAIEAQTPGRFTVGLGGAHGPRPLAALEEYLDQLDGVPGEQQPPGGSDEQQSLGRPDAPQPVGVPAQHRLLAALGPRMLKLAAERTAGAYPFLVTADYTAEARAILGDDKLLAVSHLVVVEPDASRARGIARDTLSFFTGLPGYAANLRRMGFTDDDFATLPDHMVDALAAWGTPNQIADSLHKHLAAGADHVAINVITGVTGPQPTDQWRALAPALL